MTDEKKGEHIELFTKSSRLFKDFSLLKRIRILDSVMSSLCMTCVGEDTLANDNNSTRSYNYNIDDKKWFDIRRNDGVFQLQGNYISSNELSCGKGYLEVTLSMPNPDDNPKIYGALVDVLKKNKFISMG